MAKRVTHKNATNNVTVDPEEIDKFSAIAAEWWDPRGKFKPLHKFNPVRLSYIREVLCRHFNRDPANTRPLEGLRLLDIGCGGGLLCEPMTRLGATVVGADASDANIKTASVHAQEQGLEIDYRATTAEALAAAGERFDVILNMEVVEHVASVPAFIGACGEMVKPGGVMFLATLNRTQKAYFLAILGAEYVLGWLPKGTHEWNKFVTPDELAAALAPHELELSRLDGVSFNPLLNQWRLSGDLAVNYMGVATHHRT